MRLRDPDPPRSARSPVIAAAWDPDATLKQNFLALGLVRDVNERLLKPGTPALDREDEVRCSPLQRLVRKELRGIS